MCSEKFCNIAMLQSLFNKVQVFPVNSLKRDSNTGVFLRILPNFSEHFSEENMRTTASA